MQNQKTQNRRFTEVHRIFDPNHHLVVIVNKSDEEYPRYSVLARKMVPDRDTRKPTMADFVNPRIDWDPEDSKYPVVDDTLPQLAKMLIAAHVWIEEEMKKYPLEDENFGNRPQLTVTRTRSPSDQPTAA